MWVGGVYCGNGQMAAELLASKKCLLGIVFVSFCSIFISLPILWIGPESLCFCIVCLCVLMCLLVEAFSSWLAIDSGCYLLQ